jgi:hypothetical protein
VIILTECSAPTYVFRSKRSIRVTDALDEKCLKKRCVFIIYLLQRGIIRLIYKRYSEGKRPFGRSRRKWEDNIKMDLQEVGCGCMDWIELA